MNKLLAILVVYLGGLLFGLVLVSFPASSAFLIRELDLTDQQYGGIYLPQLVLAILGALGGAFAIRHLSLKFMFTAALICLLASQLLFSASIQVPQSQALWLVMAATAFFGFGFGFGGGPLNGLASALFPSRSSSALTFLHMSAGAGLTMGPILFSQAIEANRWIVVPYSLSVAAATLMVLSLLAQHETPSGADASDTARSPSRSTFFWLVVIIAVAYALAEGTFANWAVIYALENKQLSPQIAGTALAAFWGALTVGRLMATFLLARLTAYSLWIVLPPLMAIGFLVMPFVEGPQYVIGAFALAGLACSAFFPLMVAVASEPFPDKVSFIASMLTAALMFGVGIGSYVVGSYKDVIGLDNLYIASVFYPILAMILILALRKTKDGKWL